MTRHCSVYAAAFSGLGAGVLCVFCVFVVHVRLQLEMHLYVYFSVYNHHTIQCLVSQMFRLFRLKSHVIVIFHTVV